MKQKGDRRARISPFARHEDQIGRRLNGAKIVRHHFEWQTAQNIVGIQGLIIVAALRADAQTDAVSLALDGRHLDRRDQLLGSDSVEEKIEPDKDCVGWLIGCRAQHCPASQITDPRLNDLQIPVIPLQAQP
jgi:hypothetical protein